MHLVFDIFQGLGMAAAVGIRPFLPTLVVGALAAGNVEIHFDHTDFAFLQSPGFLLGVVVLAIALAVLERRLPQVAEGREGEAVLVVLGAVLGALLFAGSLARGRYAVWPGVIGGVACAALAALATRPLLARVRTRLDREAAAAIPLYVEGLAILTAALSVVAPPLGPAAVVLLLWLLAAGRRREGQKYAGLRILR